MMASKVYSKARLAFIFWLARRLPDCRELAPVISQSLDRRLHWRERALLWLHLFTCSFCTKYQRQLHFLSEAFRGCGAEDPEEYRAGPALSPESRQRLKDALRQTGR